MFSTPDDATLEKVGQDFEVTRQRIREREEKALKRLREHSRAAAFFDDEADA